MNKNTRKRVDLWHKQQKKEGFPKPVYKKKAKPFPQPKDGGLSIMAQMKMLGWVN